MYMASYYMAATLCRKILLNIVMLWILFCSCSSISSYNKQFKAQFCIHLYILLTQLLYFFYIVLTSLSIIPAIKCTLHFK